VRPAGNKRPSACFRDTHCMGLGPVGYMTTSGEGVDDFGTVQFRYTSYMPNQPVLLRYKRVNHFDTVFGPLQYIMKSDCKKTLSDICVRASSMFLVLWIHIISGKRTAKCQMPSAPCYASMQSDWSD